MNTISRAKYEAAKAVLDRGGNQREAARIAGINEKTVGRIASGYVPTRPEEVEFRGVRPYWCSTCGYKVQTRPCVKCVAKKAAIT